MALIAGVPALNAQEPEPASDSTAEQSSEADKKPGGQAEQPKVVEAPGDVLILTTGSRMTGVQILRTTPQFYEVEVVKDVIVQVPRRQVRAVEYDDIDPAREQLLRDLFPEQQEVTIETGERVTSALRDKLMSPVTTEPLSYKNKDFVEVLEEIKTRLGVNLKVDPSVQALQPRRRNWTIDIAPERTLLALLREDLVGAFDFVVVKFELDKIIVITKDAAQNPAVTPEPAAAPAVPQNLLNN